MASSGCQVPDLEQRLRDKIAEFLDVCHDNTGERSIQQGGPASPESVAEIEHLIGAPLPAPVRVIFETLDGTFGPVSPMRGEELMYTSFVSMQVRHVTRRDIVPIIAGELDRTTGGHNMLGVSLAEPWGLLKQGETYDVDAPTSLLGWFEEVITENRTYQWPARRRIVPGVTWSPRTEITEQDLRALPVGSAIARHFPSAKRNRRELVLHVHVEPGIWAYGRVYKGSSSPTLLSLIASASSEIERDSRRARSQWVWTVEDVHSAVNHGTMLVGTVEQFEAT